MKTYQLTSSPFTLPKSVYFKTLWTIKDLPRLKLAAHALLAATPTPTETPEIQRQRDITATERSNLKYAEHMKIIRAIEDALLETVAPDDRRAVLDHVINNKAWPLDKSSRSYGRIQQAFIYKVAEKLNYI